MNATAAQNELFPPKDIYLALKRFRTSATYFGFPGDNTGEGGDTYTKPTNIGLDLISTLVAVKEGHETPNAAKTHMKRILDGLERLPTYKGIFPEFIKLEGPAPSAEVDQGRTRYSSMDAAWLHFALSIAEANYRQNDPALAARMRSLIDKADYSVYVWDGGKSFRHGITVSTASPVSTEIWPHQYDNINSEARIVLAYLVASGKVAPTIWESMYYSWKEAEGLPVAEGWNMSAFVEMTGNVYFDESKLAPRTLGLSHRNYLKASQAIANRERFTVYGWAPCFNGEDIYTEYGLDRTDTAAPYAAALLTTLDDPKTWENFEKMLEFIPTSSPPKPFPDSLDSKTGKVLNSRALALDQNLLYQAIHKETVRKLVARTGWYAEAARLMKSIDERYQPLQETGEKKANDSDSN